MIRDKAYIIENSRIGNGLYRMVLETEIAKEVRCGQFVEVSVPGFFLRRPISVCEVQYGSRIVLVYKIMGNGTKVLSEIAAGGRCDVFGPLGTGFPVEDRDVVLIGGGVGVPPLLETAKQYRARNRQVTAVFGFASEADIILADEFIKRGCATYIATMDGSAGTKGTALDAITANNVTADFVLSCGPLPMLKAINERFEEGYISLEARMACGMGACMGCVVKDTEGNSLRVCKDGPVFPIRKVAL